MSSYRNGLATGVLGTALALGGAFAGWWAYTAKPHTGSKPDVPGVPATVPKPFKEDQAAVVVLTADAEAKLAVKLAPVERKAVSRKRVFGGEVTVPPGRSVIVSAPLAGTLKPGAAPVAGQTVTAGKPVLQLLPLLDPVGRANLTASRVDADGQVKTADEQLKLARITLARAKDVLSGGGGRQRDVDDADAALKVAEQTHAVAVARRDLLARVLGDLDAGTAAPVPVDAPATGLLRNVSALPGQTVPAGAPLFEVVNLDTVWVRVPVYVGDRDELRTDGASVGPLNAPPGAKGRTSAPVPAPPAANPVSGTVDLFFAVPNTEQQWIPGQRVAVSLALKEPADALTVPWSAVLYDYFGGTWVYVKTADRTYSRERVLVRFVSGETAVLEDGPAPGKQVVATGAAELFGTETGFSK